MGGYEQLIILDTRNVSEGEFLGDLYGFLSYYKRGKYQTVVITIKDGKDDKEIWYDMRGFHRGRMAKDSGDTKKPTTTGEEQRKPKG